MRRKIPSTAALTAFEAAARHSSFTRAAGELALTQGAVCRQIAGLEEFLGVKLFRRSKRGVVLTDAGDSYHRQVAQRLDGVERDTLDLMARKGQGGALELGVVPSFGTQWLLPRLADFNRLHPNITVHMSSRTRPFLFADSGLDAAIYSGDGHWPGATATALFPESMVPVCSPGLIAPRKRLSAERLAAMPLLQQATRPYIWRQFLGALGVSTSRDLVGPRYELFSMSVRAAVLGMGVALVPELVAESELQEGRLIVPLRHPFGAERAFYLVCPESKADNPVLRVFKDWLSTYAALRFADKVN